MTILVTGSSGFIGTNLIIYLKKNNINFIGIDKKKNPYVNFKNLYLCNLKNKRKISQIIKKNNIKKIIHLAAIPGFVNCHKNPDLALQDNVIATFNLLMICKRQNIKNILVASSMGVNNFLKNPSFYGLTKFCCEHICNTFNQNFRMKIKICKFANVYGPYSLHKNSAVHTFIKKIILNKKLEIHNKGKQKRDFIFVEDVCKKMIEILNKKKNILHFNLNTNKFLRIIDVVKLLDRITKTKNRYIFSKTPKGYDDKVYKNVSSNINNNFIKKLAITYNWYRSLKKL